MTDKFLSEDAMWEAVREREENPRRPPGWAQPPERGWLFLDDEKDDIEAEYGCKLMNLHETDLMAVLNKFLESGREWQTAIWDESVCGIQYTRIAAGK